MSTSWVQLSESYTEQVIDGIPSYVCDFNITDQYGISSAIFVWSVSRETYNHVAIADEMDMYPEVLSTALTANKSFYRQNYGRLVGTSPSQLSTFMQALRLRIKELCAAWSAPTDLEFPSEVTTTIGGTD